MKSFKQVINESNIAKDNPFANEAKNGTKVNVKIGKEWVEATVTDGEPYKGKIEVKLADGTKKDVSLDKEVKFLNEAVEMDLKKLPKENQIDYLVTASPERASKVFDDASKETLIAVANKLFKMSETQKKGGRENNFKDTREKFTNITAYIKKKFNYKVESDFINESTTGEPDAELYFKMADNILNLLDLSKDISYADIKEVAQPMVDLGTLPADALSGNYAKLKSAIEDRRKSWVNESADPTDSKGVKDFIKVVLPNADLSKIPAEINNMTSHSFEIKNVKDFGIFAEFVTVKKITVKLIVSAPKQIELHIDVYFDNAGKETVLKNVYFTKDGKNFNRTM